MLRLARTSESMDVWMERVCTYAAMYMYAQKGTGLGYVLHNSDTLQGEQTTNKENSYVYVTRWQQTFPGTI